MPRTASDKRMAERWRKHARDLEKELGDPRTSGIARYAKKILKGDEAFWLWTALTTDIALWQIARAEAEAESSRLLKKSVKWDRQIDLVVLRCSQHF